MSQTASTSVTRRSVVAGLALAAAPVTVLAAADNAHAQDKQTVPEKSLDFAKVPKREKDEVLAAFADHKDEVTAGYVAATKPR